MRRRARPDHRRLPCAGRDLRLPLAFGVWNGQRGLLCHAAVRPMRGSVRRLLRQPLHRKRTLPGRDALPAGDRGGRRAPRLDVRAGCLRLLIALAPFACKSAPPSQAVPPPGPAYRSPEQEQRTKAPAERLTLLFSASVAGQLVPCGCSPDQRGGLPRAVALVKKLRAADSNLLF